jgi:hypothetical protein
VSGVNVHKVIQAHRRRVVELMQEWTRVKRDASEDDVSLSLVVDAELFRLDSVVRWLDAADSRLSRAGTEPAVGSRPKPMPAMQKAARR